MAGVRGLPPTFDFRTERTARYARLGPDPEVAAQDVRSAWVVLHGYRQLAPWFLRHFRGLDDGARLLLAPEALSRFYLGDPDGRHGPESRVGATWMTREERSSEIADYSRYLTDLSRMLIPARIDPVVLGFSQGAHTAVRWTLSADAMPSAPRAVILWGEGLPHDVNAESLARSKAREWIFVRGDGDPSRDPQREARDAELCRVHGVPMTVRTHPRGHSLDPELLSELADELDP